MTTEASIGYGSVFEILDDAVYVKIGEVTNITPPNLAVDTHDATHMESEGAAREFIAGLIDYGEVKIEMNLIPGSVSDALIREKLIARQLTEWRITLAGGSGGSPSRQLTGDAILTGYETTDPLDDKMSATVTLKISGVVTYS